MAEEREWASYFYADAPHIFVNKLGLRDERLWKAERFLVTRRAQQIYAGTIEIPRTHDLEQLRSIHHALAQDVYPWAGEIRTVTLGKHLEDNDEPRWFLRPKAIVPWMEAVSEHARSTNWATLDRNTFTTEIAALHSELNLGHTFREINGRANRIFLHQVAEQSRFRLDFDRVDAGEWNRASRDSIRPGRGRHPEGPIDYEAGRRVFEKIVTGRHVVETPSTQAREAVRLAGLGVTPTAASQTTPPTRRRAADLNTYSPAPTIER